MCLATNNAERMRITSAGKVGIGSVTPTGAVDIASGSNSYFKFGQDADNPKLEIFRTTGNASNTHYGAELQLLTGDFTFSNAAGADLGSHSYTERLRLNANGSIQITPEGSTSNPYMLIDTSGDSVRFNAKKTSGDNEFRFLIQESGSEDEALRITHEGYLHLGNTGHGTNKVGGQAVTGNDVDAYFKLLSNTNNTWSMQIRNDTSTGSNGMFLRAGNNNTSTYTLYATGTNELVPENIYIPVLPVLYMLNSSPS